MTLTQRLRQLARSSQVGVSAAFIVSGTKTSTTAPTSMPWKSRAATPMTSIGRPLMVIDWPTTAGSPPKRRFQKPWLSTTTGAPPAVRSSSGVMVRPMVGPTPSTSK